jgi:hypothetical protein
MGKKTEGNNHLEDLGVGRKMVLKWTLQEQYGRVWTGFIWLRIGNMDSIRGGNC